MYMLLDHNVCADMIDGSFYDVYLYLQDCKSPLMMALSEGHFEIVKLLLDKGAMFNHQNKVSYS